MPTFEWTAVGDQPGCRQVAAAAMDPQIKLFGQTISVSPSHTGAGADAGVLNPLSAYTPPPSSQDGEDSVHCAVESKGPSEKLVSAARCSSGDELFQLHMKGREGGMAPSGVPHLCDEQSEGGVSDERDSHSMGSDGKSQQQKAEKIVACPRCSSQDTKFCYYNNYNVNQPRHFCKNCQRYWTAGGTLRNVPVGAGRRKNKASGGVHQQGRESSEASLTCSSFQMELSEFSCGVGSPKTKVSPPHPKRVAGQGSPVRSPGSSGQESGITTYSLYQNGRLPFQSYIGGSQDYTASEISAVGSSDTASTRRGGPRLLRLPSGSGGLDLECSRSSRSEHMLDSAAHLRVAPHSVSLRESLESGWAGNNSGGQAPVRFFNGEWPNGYPVDWDRKQQHQHPGASVLTSFSNASSVPTPAPWVSTPWPSTTPWAGPPQQSVVGKRQGERLEESSLPAKTSRAHVETRSKWPMLQGMSSSSPATEMMQLLQPKLQPSDELNSAFMNRLFNNARRVPFPVTI